MNSNIAPAPRVCLRPVEVPQPLQEGDKFIKWDEESGPGVPVTLRVDPKGFFLYWTDQNLDVDLLDLATIRDVRTGTYAKLPKEAKTRGIVSIGSATAGALEEKTVTVCYGSDFVNVNFVNFCCAKRETAQLWADELLNLAFNLNQLNASALRHLEKIHTRLTLRADKHERVLVKNVVRVFATSKEGGRRVEKALSEAGLPAQKGEHIPADKFTFDDFFQFYKSLTHRTEVHQLFEKLSGGKPVIQAAQLVEFLNETQRDPRLNEILHPYADVSRARDLIKQHEPNRYHAQRDQLTIDGFLRYLLSEDAAPVQQARLDLSDDMDQPLAHYFINSSHNTYLTGHQITGKSSVEIYRQTLLAGCRCVELDFWNGRTEEPVIVHGYTFVPEINAREVLEAIAECAFKTSEYPVILSFENHCNSRQQAKIADYCREIFKDMLLDSPLDSHPLEVGGELPSPAMLKRKIIIKNKRKHHHRREPEPANGHLQRTQSGCEEVERAEPRQSVEESSEAGVEAGETGETGEGGESESGSSSEGEGEGDGETEGGAGGGAGGGRETHAAAAISALVNYVEPVHFSTFDAADKKARFYEMSSFDEKQATTLLKEHPVEFVNYNKRQLSRVYPAGTRFDSSNFMPQVFWNAGCQLVALNYQTLDLGMQLNLAAFEYNRRCGYLLKPEFMRRRDRRLDPFAESTVDGIIAGSVSVTVLSGQLLTDRRVGTYVEVDMFGLPADTVRRRCRTRTVPNNGIDPLYESEPFVFRKVVLPELAALRLAAHEDNGRLIGHRVLPLLGLCPGYRHVNLRTELGAPLSATLFLHIVVNDYVPDTLSELAEALANPIKYQSELDKREHQLAVLTADTEPTEEVRADTAGKGGGEGGARAAGDRGGGAGGGGGGGPPPDVAPPPAPPPDTEVAALDDLLASRQVRDLRNDLARKLDALRRKQLRPEKKPSKFSVSNKLVKRISNKHILFSGSEFGESSGASGPSEVVGGGAERELRLRYHDAIFEAIDKHARTHHHLQVKRLTEQLEADKKEVLVRLAAARKEDVRALVKRSPRDKDEIVRIKREIHSQSVERGVAECGRLQARFVSAREELARSHDRLRARIQALRDHERELITTPTTNTPTPTPP